MRNVLKIFFFFALLIFTAGYVKSQPGCPNINAGPDQTINCTTTSTNLTATVLATGATTSYSVSQIPYTPPNPFNSGTPILVNQDDIWSQPITLPFNFCFFGNLYDKVLIGSNELVTFDISSAGNTCHYALYSGTTIPTSSYQINSIMAPYQDIDPSYQGSIYWQLIGTYPCRILVVSYYEVPYFGDPNSVYTGNCPSPLFATSQIALYESTNVIEIYIKNKGTCPGWNNGLAVEGIQNADGTIAYSVPGRNGTVWTASNDAYRFTPNGTPNYSITWLQGTTQIGTTPTITVSPTTMTTYTAQVVYDCCSGNQVTVTDDVVVNVSNSVGLTINPANPAICGGGSSTLTASSTDPTAIFNWSTGSTTAAITVSPTSTTTYTVTASTPGCSTQASVDVTVSSNPVMPVNSPAICNGQSATLTASGATSYIWSTGSTDSSITVSPANTTTYTVTGTISGCTGTGTGIVTVNPLPNAQITFSSDASCGNNDGSATATGGSSYLWSNGITSATITGLTPGNYTVTVTSAAGCSSSTSVIINNSPLPTPATSTINEKCKQANGSATVTASGGSGTYTYLWSNGVTSSTVTGLTAGSYSVTVSDGICTASATAYVMETPGPNADFSAHPNVLTIMDGPVLFSDNSSGTIVNWQWNFGDGSPNGSGEEINHDYANFGTYLVTLIVTDNYECTDTVTDTIKVKDIFAFYIPNAFTPDDDNINDIFLPKGINIDLENYEMTIYNRWGNIIFRTTNLEEGWNGTYMNKGNVLNDIVVDTYVYMIKVKELEGPKHEYFGKFSLVR